MTDVYINVDPSGHLINIQVSGPIKDQQAIGTRRPDGWYLKCLTRYRSGAIEQTENRCLDRGADLLVMCEQMLRLLGVIPHFSNRRL